MCSHHRLLFRSFLVFTAMVALAACSSLSQLRKEEPQAETYASSLASEYLDYANAEQEQGHSFEAEHFASKGLRSLRGEHVAPEEISGKDLTPEEKLKLEVARKKLLAAVNERTQKILPQKTARAQLLFDCWLEKSADHRPRKEISLCGDEFLLVLDELEHMPGSTESRIPHFEIFFDSGSTELNEKSGPVVMRAVRVARNLKACEVQLTGYSDRVGNARVNMKLAQSRVKVVQDALKKYKLCGGKMSAVAVGENASRVQSSNGIAQAQNRRVDIDIKGEAE